VDADGDGTVQPTEPSVHLYSDGGAFYYAMATSHRDVLPATNSTMTVNIDMGRLLQEIDALAASNAMPNDSVSQQLARNLAVAISGVE
jgi:hypothetical protein